MGPLTPATLEQEPVSFSLFSLGKDNAPALGQLTLREQESAGQMKQSHIVWLERAAPGCFTE